MPQTGKPVFGKGKWPIWDRPEKSCESAGTLLGEVVLPPKGGAGVGKGKADAIAATVAATVAATGATGPMAATVAGWAATAAVQQLEGLQADVSPLEQEIIQMVVSRMYRDWNRWGQAPEVHL